MYKALREVAEFFSNVLQSPIFDGRFIPSQLYLFMNGLIFQTLFLVLNNLMQPLLHI